MNMYMLGAMKVFILIIIRMGATGINVHHDHRIPSLRQIRIPYIFKDFGGKNEVVIRILYFSKQKIMLQITQQLSFHLNWLDIFISPISFSTLGDLLNLKLKLLTIRNTLKTISV